MLSAEMILASHAPSNLHNLLPGKDIAKPVVQEEPAILRPDLRGEILGDKVQCLGCSCENKKKFYTSSGWNRHCRGQHAAPPLAAPLEGQLAEVDAKETKRKSAPGKRKEVKGGAGENATKQAAQPAARPAARPAAGRAERPVPQPAAQQPAAQSAKQQAAEQPAAFVLQRDVHYNTCNDNSVVDNEVEQLITKADNAQLPLSSSERPGSPSSRNESTVPSKKSVSREAQAGKRSSPDRKSRKCSSIFSNEFSEKDAATLT